MAWISSFSYFFDLLRKYFMTFEKIILCETNRDKPLLQNNPDASAYLSRLQPSRIIPNLCCMWVFSNMIFTIITWFFNMPKLFNKNCK